MEMPKLFSKPVKVWKLKRAIYGLKNSPRAYFLHVKSKFEELGFQQFEADPCLFISPTVICLVYVDDALFIYRLEDNAKKLTCTCKMKKLGMLFEEESDIAGYLGILIERNISDNTITLCQSGLVQRIVDALHLDDNTPSVDDPTTDYLAIDDDGKKAHGLYNYASVNGMLQYLQGHTRPDISFAVSQTSRYVHSPKRSHEIALEQIGRYLKGTIDKGIILKPDPVKNELKMDIYVDAAFASGWGTKLGTNPDSVKSRTGYVILIAGCPVVWCSKLQDCIACSTMESEYTALSLALCAAIPLLELMRSICKALLHQNPQKLTIRATIHEDNQGALKRAKLEPNRHTTRSKFYALKLHWFRSWLEPNKINLVFCPTEEQIADILTKSPATSVFQNCCKMLMGW